MKKMPILFLLNAFYMIALVAGSVAWFASKDTVGVVFGLALLVCAVLIFKGIRLGYIFAAVLSVGMLKLSIDKYSGVYEESIKHTVSSLALISIVLAIVLHETYAKKIRCQDDDSKAES